jgi:hypothetical protein
VIPVSGANLRRAIPRNYRILRGWTQEIAAEETGVSVRTWRRYETTGAPNWLRKQIAQWAKRACPEHLPDLT